MRAEPIDLSVNVPPWVIGEADFAEANRRAMERLRALPSGGLYHHNGTPEAQAAITGWLARGGVAAEPGEAILCNGAQQALHLALAECARTSRIVASEGETFSGAILAAVDLGLDWAPVAHDDEGMLPDALDRVLRESGCRTVFTTPVCQNPLGFETGEARRRAIVEVCRRNDAAIVEDDIYAIYAAKGRVTYRELAPERCWYLTSLSKCLTPLVRLGTLIPPPGRAEPVLRALRAQSFGVAPAALELGCALLELGADVGAAEWLRGEAKARIALAQEILGLDRVPMPEGAPHLWLPMAEERTSAFAASAEAAGVRVTPPNASAIGPRASSGIRLCLLAPERRADAEAALRVLAGIERG
ncbi:MAG: PLP-dependent aminotransferase family protein [Candidatus Andeanibacterium colombiense]|uniref:PLP-dependent aminotransferase family protein n=1 Tax=Candidatus Andeanibacterium colombiense TaxID=3121345 RepID=A0AAJ6BRD1_9SPHN|nr:MAG: PLP-dependent aminotransferase family protein [Sphingomonadaceae bacterium]